MGDWLITLEGSERDVEFLVQFLSQSPFSVVDGPTGKALTLPGLPRDADSEAVQVAANTLIEIVNGATRLYNDRFDSVRFVKVSRLGDDGKWQGYGYLTVGPRSTHLTVYREGDDTLAHWVSTGLLDEDVGRALGLFGSLEPTWKNLYLVFEVIVESIGGQNALEAKGWVPASDIRRYKQTANSYRAIGREARHAKLSFQPPPNPMSLNEAHELVRTILSVWLEERNINSG